MKTTTSIRVIAAVLLAASMGAGLTGCGNMTGRQRDTVVGAGLGGAAGAVLGGGVVGTAVGAGAGGLIGNQLGK